VLHSFNPDQPYAGLVFDPAGNLYGTTISGGTGNGSVFRLAPNHDGSWTESVLHSFVQDGKDGWWPTSGLIFDQAGNLYGTTAYGGAYTWGIVFELNPNLDGSWTESVLHSFNDNDGGRCAAGVIIDQAGNLYGTGWYGGAHFYGIAFQLTPNGDGSWTESVLHSFNDDGMDGYQPFAGIAFDQAGNLYGTTTGGGAHGHGAVFKLTPSGDGSWKESMIHSFNNSGVGQAPSASLIFDQAGNLYGTTQDGGAYGYGTVFRLSPVNGVWKVTVLHSFQNKPGAYPYANLVLDAAGDLYGTTSGDGNTTFGSVFEITP